MQAKETLLQATDPNRKPSWHKKALVVGMLLGTAGATYAIYNNFQAETTQVEMNGIENLATSKSDYSCDQEIKKSGQNWCQIDNMDTNGVAGFIKEEVIWFTWNGATQKKGVTRDKCLKECTED